MPAIDGQTSLQPSLLYSLLHWPSPRHQAQGAGAAVLGQILGYDWPQALMKPFQMHTGSPQCNALPLHFGAPENSRALCGCHPTCSTIRGKPASYHSVKQWKCILLYEASEASFTQRPMRGPQSSRITNIVCRRRIPYLADAPPSLNGMSDCCALLSSDEYWDEREATCLLSSPFANRMAESPLASSYPPEAIQSSKPFHERNGSCNLAQAQAAAPLRRYRSQVHAAGGVFCSDLALFLFLFQPQALFLMAT